MNLDAAAHERRGAEGETLTVARNVSTRYLAIGVEAVLGLVVLPFNVAHLGTAAYGLWMLTASVTAYFSVLDLGYSGARTDRLRGEREVHARQGLCAARQCR